MSNKLKFGDYCTIEQNRYGCENEHYVHKVIDTFRSNTWVDVPVVANATETFHDHMEDVVSCICCGVCETEVLKYRLSDVIAKETPTPSPLPTSSNTVDGDAIGFARYLRIAEWQDGTKTLFKNNDYEELYKLYKETKQ